MGHYPIFRTDTHRLGGVRRPAWNGRAKQHLKKKKEVLVRPDNITSVIRKKTGRDWESRPSDLMIQDSGMGGVFCNGEVFSPPTLIGRMEEGGARPRRPAT